MLSFKRQLLLCRLKIICYICNKTFYDVATSVDHLRCAAFSFSFTGQSFKLPVVCDMDHTKQIENIRNKLIIPIIKNWIAV